MVLQASPRDSGVYTCQISAYKPTELNHTLTVRGQYSISSISIVALPSEVSISISLVVRSV